MLASAKESEMEIPEHLHKLIESGRQVGIRLTVTRDGESCYVSLAMQKLRETYHTYCFIIKEKNFDSDEEDLEDHRKWGDLPAAWAHLSKISGLDLTQMTTLKGTKVFNPEHF